MLKIKYEDLVTHPDKFLPQIGDFIGLENSIFDAEKLNPKNIHKYKSAFSPTQLQQVTNIIGQTLTQQNYS